MSNFTCVKLIGLLAVATHLAIAVESSSHVELSRHLCCKLSSMVCLWRGVGWLEGFLHQQVVFQTANDLRESFDRALKVNLPFIRPCIHFCLFPLRVKGHNVQALIAFEKKKRSMASGGICVTGSL